MQLPNELQVLVGLVVLFLVTNGLKALSELIGRDLSGWGTILTAAIVGAVILFTNTLLTAVPVNAQPFVEAIFKLVVLLLGAIGVKRVEVKMRAA